MNDFTVTQVIEAWKSVTDEWFVRRNKMHNNSQWEVVQAEQGRGDNTMKVIARCHSADEAHTIASDFEELARGGAVMELINGVRK